MPNLLAHFAIEADDVSRARRFYEAVFGWSFTPWGPPDFYLVRGAGVGAALQKRREKLPEGRKGFECTFAVDDLSAAIGRVEAAGGRVIGPRHAIPSVGALAQFADTEGNVAILMQYEPGRLEEMGVKA
jgi:uncharacterized protein